MSNNNPDQDYRDNRSKGYQDGNPNRFLPERNNRGNFSKTKPYSHFSQNYRNSEYKEPSNYKPGVSNQRDVYNQGLANASGSYLGDTGGHWP